MIILEQLKVEPRNVVAPGEVLAEGMDYLPGYGTYRKDDKIIAKKLGLMNPRKRVVKLIPLSGRYLPSVDDVIIGRISDISIGGWRVEINSAYTAMISMKEATTQYIKRGADLTKWFDVGDYVVTKIINVTSQNLIDLTMKDRRLKKLEDGRVVKISCAKVPRVIGRGGSMVMTVKSATNCEIIVGQNGLVWVSGKPKDEVKAVEAIKMIDRKSHISGLTDVVKEFLEGE